MCEATSETFDGDPISTLNTKVQAAESFIYVDQPKRAKQVLTETFSDPRIVGYDPEDQTRKNFIDWYQSIMEYSDPGSTRARVIEIMKKVISNLGIEIPKLEPTPQQVTFYA